MKFARVIIFFGSLSFCCAETLRISEIADRASDGTEQMTIPGKEPSEVLFVKKVPVIGDADVRQAVPNFGLDNDFYVELTDKGAGKLKKVTERMIFGRDRLAIIVGERLVYAPVVRSPLGGEFVISGLDDRTPREIDDLARKMSGRPPRPEGVEPPVGQKGLDRKPPALKVIYPQMDPSAKDFDIAAFVEGIRVLNPKVELTIRDMGGLISTAMIMEKALRSEPSPEPTIDLKCEFFDVLARNFREVAALSSKATNGKIPLKSLTDAMTPYVNGDKTWPIRTRSEQAAPSDGDKPSN